MLLLELPNVSLDLDDLNNGLYVDTVDTGWPEVRDEVYVLPDQDGVADYTKFMGQRVVSLTGTAVETGGLTRGQVLDRLRRFCVPNIRPTLTVAAKGEDPRKITLRSDAHSAPMMRPGSAKFAVAWRSVDPRFYSAVTNTAVVLPPALTRDGRAYDLTFDRLYPLSFGGAGIVDCVNAGVADTWPKVRFYGPLLNPTLTNQTTGEMLAFDIDIAQGDYLVADTGHRAVYLNDDPSADRYSHVDIAQTTWYPLRPGSNLLRLMADTYAVPAQARIEWTDAYL